MIGGGTVAALYGAPIIAGFGAAGIVKGSIAAGY